LPRLAAPTSMRRRSEMGEAGVFMATSRCNIRWAGCASNSGVRQGLPRTGTRIPLSGTLAGVPERDAHFRQAGTEAAPEPDAGQIPPQHRSNFGGWDLNQVLLMAPSGGRLERRQPSKWPVDMFRLCQRWWA
jgi:hypothetical protein